MTKVIVLFKNNTYSEFEYKICKFVQIRDLLLDLGYEIISVIHDDIELSHTIIVKENNDEE